MIPLHQSFKEESKMEKDEGESRKPVHNGKAPSIFCMCVLNSHNILRVVYCDQRVQQKLVGSEY